MRVSSSPRRKNAPRPAEKSAPAFLQYIRGRECAFADHGGCEGKIEAMHLDFAGDKGMSSKVSDRYAIPACSAHHRRQHSVGWLTFCKRMNVTKEQLLIAAARLWNAWPSRVAWERKMEASRG
jgi:hypothetical protein